ncbi:hypothetical protein ACLMJK_007356 [Lecanora helva]
MRISMTIAVCCTAIAGAIPTSGMSKPIKSDAQQYTDAQILNFALGLEHFQDSFYRSALANWTEAQFAEAGFNADFYTNLTAVAAQQHTHVTSLTKTLTQLNVTPVEECVYNFNGTSPRVFVQDASLIEAVSVSSYITLLVNLSGSAYQRLFASVLAVEARHASFIRAALGEQPFPSPYDTPLDLDEANTLVQLFVVSCPQPNPLALKNFPTLSSSYSNRGAVGNEVTFVTYGQDIKAGSDSTPLFAAFLTLTGPVFAPTKRLPNNGGFNATVPAAPEGFAPISGTTYVVLSTSDSCLNDDIIVAGPASIEIFPK